MLVPCYFKKIKNKINCTHLRICCYNRTSCILFYPWLNKSEKNNPEIIGHLWKNVKSTISTKINIGSLIIFHRFLLREQEIHWRNNKETQIQTMCRWKNATMVSQPLGNYASVLIWISVRLILDIASIRKLPSRSIKFVLAFIHNDIYVDVFMKLFLGMVFYGNSG